MLRDGLMSLASRMGTDRDKAATTFYTQPMLSDEQIIAAYRGSWLPRKIVDIPALDSCRKWRDWQAKKPQIEAIEDEETRLNVKGKILEASKKGRLFGGAAVYIGTGDANPADPLEVERVGNGGLKYLTVMTRRQLTAGEIERDPASEWYGRPKLYTLSGANGMQIDIHPSRLVIFNGAMAPDEDFNQALNLGWGESVLTSTLDAIKNADSTAGNIASLIFEAKIDIIKVPQFSANIGNQAYEDSVLRRYTLANTIKGINGTLILDSEEEYESKSAHLGGLTDILMAFMQIVSGAADIPVTRLLGQSPAGMNSTGTSDMKNYHDRIQSMQELEMQPAMVRLDECLERSAGVVDPDVYYQWAPLEQMSEKERAEIFKTTADAARQLVGTTAGQEIIPREAVSDALVNRLVEDGVLPGLDAAIEEYSKLSEQEPSEEELAAAAAASNQNQPPAKQRQAANDAAPRTLYVSRKVINADDLIEWAKGQGFKTTLPADDLRVTIALSRTPVDWMKVGESWAAELKIAAGGPRLMEKFGEAKVLLFKAAELDWRHDDIKRAGASWDHPEYQSHITISYDPDAPDLADVEPYQGEIVLGPEIFAEVNEDWKAGVSET
jgi:phage-related protein (TIGR01555 family)